MIMKGIIKILIFTESMISETPVLCLNANN